MNKPIRQALPELVDAGIINDTTAEAIRSYYAQREDSNPNRQFIIFGVLGATLVGLGIILIIAHNWDFLSKSIKTLIAFIPLLLGQGIVAYTLLRRRQSASWREASAAFLIFAVGAAMALISQIYHIEGQLSGFLFTWILLSLPLIYILPSSFAAILSIAGITWYGCELGYFHRFGQASIWPWLLLLLIVPYFIKLYRQHAQSNAFLFLNWLLPMSITILLGSLGKQEGILLFIGYFSWFGLSYQIGRLPVYSTLPLRRNGWIIFGSLGTVIMLLILSFNEVWEDIASNIDRLPSWWCLELLVAILLTVGTIALYWWHRSRQQAERRFNPIAWVFLAFWGIFFLGMQAPTLATVLTNLILFAIGVSYIRRGGIENHLGLLNYGLLIITALIFCRFFDTDIPFVMRGLLFVLVGIGFFAANYWFLKKRKSNKAVI